MEEGFKLIGKDCENIIWDYVAQLDYTEKYNKVMNELKAKTFYLMMSDRFSVVWYNERYHHFYLGSAGSLMIVRNMTSLFTYEEYIDGVDVEILILD